jgi:hypothetical protein
MFYKKGQEASLALKAMKLSCARRFTPPGSPTQGYLFLPQFRGGADVQCMSGSSGSDVTKCCPFSSSSQLVRPQISLCEDGWLRFVSYRVMTIK